MYGIQTLALFGGTSFILVVVSIVCIRFFKKKTAHKYLQIFISFFMFVGLMVFEWDVRQNDWRIYAEESPLFPDFIYPLLIVHLLFALPTVSIWSLTLFQVLKSKKTPINHTVLGKVSVIGFFLTYLSGLLFYYLSFVLKA